MSSFLFPGREILYKLRLRSYAEAGFVVSMLAGLAMEAGSSYNSLMCSMFNDKNPSILIESNATFPS